MSCGRGGARIASLLHLAITNCKGLVGAKQCVWVRAYGASVLSRVHAFNCFIKPSIQRPAYGKRATSDPI